MERSNTTRILIKFNHWLELKLLSYDPEFDIRMVEQKTKQEETKGF